MSFDRQTEKAAEDLSDPFDAMIRMCGFVFENLRSDKLPGRIGFFRCSSTFLRRRRESARTFFTVFADPFAEGTFPDSDFPCDVFGLITFFKIELHSLELVGRRITGSTPIRPSFRCVFHFTPSSLFREKCYPFLQTLQTIFPQLSTGRKQCQTVTVRPNSCNINSKDPGVQLVIMETLKSWGIVCA